MNSSHWDVAVRPLRDVDRYSILKAHGAACRPIRLIQGEFDMAGPKEAYSIELNPDQMAFVRQAKEKYNLASEDKAMRVVLDYLITSPGILDTVFSEPRCLRCE